MEGIYDLCGIMAGYRMPYLRYQMEAVSSFPFNSEAALHTMTAASMTYESAALCAVPWKPSVRGAMAGRPISGNSSIQGQAMTR